MAGLNLIELDDHYPNRFHAVKDLRDKPDLVCEVDNVNLSDRETKEVLFYEE